ncbi:MAG TPA: CotH kinase family protein [Kofleriaceae bacterium]|nr:CotH kinase family protein [Kofleriaceae bacterium]
MVKGALVAALMCAWVGCSSPPSADADAAIADAPPPDADGKDSDDLLFSSVFMPDLDILLQPDALAALREQPREWACGRLRFSGDLYPIGVRLKGSASFQGIDRKPAFKIRFDGPCGSDERFFGRVHLTLNNLVQDRSNVREALAYRVFRAAGAPAPRTGYARVFVNGALYGLYVNVESVDADMLARHYADPTGPLYEGTLEVDLFADDVALFEQDEGPDTGRAELTALVERLESQPGDGVFYDDDAPIDAAAFHTYLAAVTVTGDWDGYWKPNNYRIYYEPASQRWSFSPWGLDQAWLLDRTAFDGVGTLIDRCMRSRRCLRDYLRELERVLAVAEELDLEREQGELVDFIAAAAEEDPKRPYPAIEVEIARRALPVRFATLFAKVRAQLGCLGALDDPGATSLDLDQDGWPACTLDCDDGDETRHPANDETCNGIDDDCDGLVDDDLDCACQEKEVRGATFRLCLTQLEWAQARQDCQDHGGDLAWVDDLEQNFALWTWGKATFAQQWLLGLNDRGKEGVYRWADGSEPAFFTWYKSEPNNILDEDCGELSGQRDANWNDIDCATARPYLCRQSEDE